MYYLIDGLVVINSLASLTDNPFGGVKLVFAVGSNLITSGVFTLLDCKACKNGGNQDVVDVEGIIAGVSGSILYGSAHSFPLAV
jgi:hypothetical protein